MISQLLIMYRVGQGKGWTADVTSMNSSEATPSGSGNRSKTVEIRFAKPVNPSATMELSDRTRSTEHTTSVFQIEAQDLKADELDMVTAV
jgi:hypothetical protein